MSRYVSMPVATIVAVICCSAKADDVSGRIGDSATWSGTIVVTKTVTVAPAAVLTIRSGTRVVLHKGCGLVVEGRLLAEGRKEAPIHFVPASDAQPGDWNSLVIRPKGPEAGAS